MDTNGAQAVLWPLAAYAAAVVLLAAFMVVSSYLLGQRHMDAQTGEPYESGIRPTGTAWIHFDVKYYLIAMFFVVFDVESVFIYAWAVEAARGRLAGVYRDVRFRGAAPCRPRLPVAYGRSRLGRFRKTRKAGGRREQGTYEGGPGWMERRICPL